MKGCFFSLLLIFASATLFGGYNHDRYILIGTPVNNPGFFSVMMTVLGCLDLYENEEYGGIEIDLGTGGHYHDLKKGSNWWNYYFEPVKIGSSLNKTIVPFGLAFSGRIAMKTEKTMKRTRAYELLNHYVKPKQDVRDRVDQFVNDYFGKKRVIGVHYRGTDKYLEAPRVPYDIVINEIKKYLEKEDLIFVATDEELFLETMHAHFPDQVIYFSTIRSSNTIPIHSRKQDHGFQLGLEALLDCLLLSKTDLLIRTSSNLSLFSTYFNPELPVIELNRRR